MSLTLLGTVLLLAVLAFLIFQVRVYFRMLGESFFDPLDSEVLTAQDPVPEHVHVEEETTDPAKALLQLTERFLRMVLGEIGDLEVIGVCRWEGYPWYPRDNDGQTSAIFIDYVQDLNGRPQRYRLGASSVGYVRDLFASDPTTEYGDKEQKELFIEIESKID